MPSSLALVPPFSRLPPSFPRLPRAQTTLFLLFECASGYALFERLESEEIGQELPDVQKSVTDLQRFGKIIKLKSFVPFKTAAHALENINDVSEGSSASAERHARKRTCLFYSCTHARLVFFILPPGIVNEHLREFLEITLPPTKPGKKAKYQLGVAEPKLGSAILEAIGVRCVSNDVTTELFRGIRRHLDKLIQQFKEGDLAKAQLGLGHSFSRAKVRLRPLPLAPSYSAALTTPRVLLLVQVKFNVNRSDNMIIQSISLLDQLDKDLNTFAMRVRYGGRPAAAWDPPGLLVNMRSLTRSRSRRTWIGTAASGTAGTSRSWSRLSTTTTSTRVSSA